MSGKIIGGIHYRDKNGDDVFDGHGGRIFINENQFLTHEILRPLLCKRFGLRKLTERFHLAGWMIEGKPRSFFAPLENK